MNFVDSPQFLYTFINILEFEPYFRFKVPGIVPEFKNFYREQCIMLDPAQILRYHENMPEAKQQRKKVKKSSPQQKQLEVSHPHTGKVLFSWSAYEYEYYKKNADWYWWVGFFAIILLGFALWQRSFLFVLVILLGWFTVVLYAVRPPQMISFSIAERGVLVGNRLYHWHDLRSFWVFYNPPLHKELFIAPKKTLMSALKINLGDTDPVLIHDTLVKFLPEIEEEDSLIDNLARLVRF